MRGGKGARSFRLISMFFQGVVRLVDYVGEHVTSSTAISSLPLRVVLAAGARGLDVTRAQVLPT